VRSLSLPQNRNVVVFGVTMLRQPAGAKRPVEKVLESGRHAL
jgi:hypothetical protein